MTYIERASIIRRTSVPGIGPPPVPREEETGAMADFLDKLSDAVEARRDELARHLMRRSPHLGHAKALFVAKAWARNTRQGVRLRADPAHKLPNAVLYRRAEAEACWHKATAPVLFVTGAESRLLDALGDSPPPSSFEPQFADMQSQVIDAAGHMIHFEAPADLARAIEGFLATIL